MKSPTFYKVTNKEIYKEIQCIKKQLNKLAIRTSVNAALIAIVVSVAAAFISRLI